MSGVGIKCLLIESSRDDGQLELLLLGLIKPPKGSYESLGVKEGELIGND